MLHPPLPPLALCVVLFVLAMTGQAQMNLLWIITSVLAFAWFSWLASTYWEGHLGAVFGGIGHFGGVVNSTVGSSTTRKVQLLTQRLLVQDSRLAVSAVIVLCSSFRILVVVAPWPHSVDAGDSCSGADRRCWGDRLRRRGCPSRAPIQSWSRMNSDRPTRRWINPDHPDLASHLCRGHRIDDCYVSVCPLWK